MFYTEDALGNAEAYIVVFYFSLFTAARRYISFRKYCPNLIQLFQLFKQLLPDVMCLSILSCVAYINNCIIKYRPTKQNVCVVVKVLCATRYIRVKKLPYLKRTFIFQLNNKVQ